MRSRVPVAVALVGLLSAPWSFAQITPRRSESDTVQAYKLARASYDKALKHFEKRDLDKTMKELETCVSRMADFSDAYLLMAKVRYLEKRFPEALAHMEKAESCIDASNAVYFQAQTDRWRELQQHRDRQDVVIEGLREQLSRATSQDQRIALQGRIDQAMHDRDELQRQLIEPPNEVAGMPADYPFFHGNILLRLNRLDDAAAKYREALKIKPDHADASNNLASLYFTAGHPKVALQILEQAEANGVVVNAELKAAVLKALGQ